MADVRALLRQQRAARRITHPLATYSDAGKLLCTLCRDQIRAEAHWDAHLLSEKHKKLLAAAPNGEEDGQDEAEDEAEAEAEAEDDARAADDAMSTTSQKRKHDDLGTDDEDLDMDHDQDERRKRNKPEASDLSRKKSTMPSQGVEVQIPSRASTPIHHREHSSSSSVHSQPTNAPAVAIATTTAMTTSLPSRQASNLATPASSSSMMSVQYTNPQPTATTAPTTTTTTTAQQVNEDEWAAFEADIAATAATETTYDDATISRPAMTAQESAIAKESAFEAEAAQNPESRKSKADADIEDEREEATRALEDEFEEMQELEARVQRLKEKREAFLRTRRESLVEPADMDIPESQEATVKPTPGVEDDEAKENVKAAEDVDDTEAEDDEDDEDDWDGFRFRTGR